MLHRRLARTCLMAALVAVGCQKPPAETTPPDTTAAQPGDEAEAEAEKPLPDAQAVLDQSLEAAGGKAALEAMKSSYTVSKTEIAAQGISITTHTWIKDEKMYSEAEIPGMGKQQQWKDGDDLYAKDPVFGFRKLEGKELAQARWVADGPMLALSWKDHFAKAETTGRNEEGDSPVLEVTLTAEDGRAIVLHFDEQTHLMVGMAFDQVSPMGDMPVRNRMSDFREVNGVQIPYRTVMEVQMQSMETVTEKYEVNVEIDDAKFVVPVPGQEPPADAEPEPEPEAKKAKGKKAKGKKAKKSKGAK